MNQITPEILQKISQRCSGQAMKIYIEASAKQITAALGSHPSRVVDASNGNFDQALDDKATTIVTGCENMSWTEFSCFLSKMEGLRFRNILIFPTQTWEQAEEGEIKFWDRMGTILEGKFARSVQKIVLNG